MKFCCATQMFQKHGLQAAIEIAARCGFDSLDLWSSPGRSQHLDPELGREHFGNIRQQAETHGLSIRALSTYGIHSPEKGLSTLFKYLRAARQIGARILITGTGVKKDAITWDKYFEYLRPLVHKAADEGVIVALENHINGFLETPEDCLRLVDHFGSQYLGITFSGHHFHSAGYDPMNALELLDERVKVFYAWDKKRGVSIGEFDLGGPDDQIPGQGQLDFQSALRYLNQHTPKVQPLTYWRGSEGWDVERLTEALHQIRKYLGACLSDSCQ